MQCSYSNSSSDSNNNNSDVNDKVNNNDIIIRESEEVMETKRSCVDCHTTRTPCWRGGPAGPRTLCNACGIRYRKRRKGLIALDKEGEGNKKAKIFPQSSYGGGGGGDGSSKLLNFWLKGLKRRKLGEEEQAAILLMALSCNYVYA